MLAHVKNAWDRWSVPLLGLVMIGLVVGFLSAGIDALRPKPNAALTATKIDQGTIDRYNHNTCAQLQEIGDRSSKEALKVLPCPKT